MNRGLRFLLAAAVIAAACAVGGCSNTPDTVEDPLSAYGIDGVLPFETSKPEVVATPAPSPTVNPDELTTDAGYGKDWQTDTSGVGDLPDDSGDIEDDFSDLYDDPTPRPTQKPTATATVTGYQKLQYGDTGDAVKKLQRRLKNLGYYSGSLDGDFGSGTVAAVKVFQGIMGYAESGIASVAVQESLFSQNAPTYSATPAPTAKRTPIPQTTPSSDTGYARLQKGDSGASVKRLQNRLKTLGYYTGSADGDFGSGTVAAVKEFQAAMGLAQTGVATVAMQTKLFSASAPYYDGGSFDEDDYDDYEDIPLEDEYVKLQKGSNGDRVYELQQRLAELGYYAGDVDGTYGSSTVTAVKLFQKTLGLNQTGVATAALQKKLFSTSAAAYEGEAENQNGNYKTLSPGDSGSAVKNMQNRLGELGYYTGTLNGKFDAKTTKAVRLFQAALGVNETGVATASFQKKLFADNAPFFEEEPPAETGYVELRKGDSGDDVTNLQARLTALGYYTGNINGAFNAKTVTAVKLFEAAYAQPQTGVATVKLQKKLFASDALPYEAPAPEEEDKVTQYTRLAKGDSGTKVKKLQRRLKELGYFTGSIGGNYQKLTTDAVTRFQLAVDLNPSGIATVATQQALYADDAPYYETDNKPDYKPSSTTLRRGDTGQDVSSLQSRLIDLGYIKDASSIKSGTYDQATAYAVADAQAARGYDSVGDIADSDFLSYIFSDAAWDYALIDYEGG